MKRLLVLAMLACVAWPVRAELPKDLEELKALHAEQGKTPQGTMKLWLDACFVFMNPDTREAGAEMIQYLTIPLKDQDDWHTSAVNRLFVDRLTDPNKQHIFRSYAKGTSPENGYAMDPSDWELNWVRNHQRENDDRGIQCYLDSTGADADRPIYLKQSVQSGLYYVNIYSTIYVDVRPPKDPNREEFR